MGHGLPVLNQVRFEEPAFPCDGVFTVTVRAGGYVTDLEKLDLSAVRLCFQVFLLDSNKKFSQVVPPAVSHPIIDKSLLFFFSVKLRLKPGT